MEIKAEFKFEIIRSTRHTNKLCLFFILRRIAVFCLLHCTHFEIYKNRFVCHEPWSDSNLSKSFRLISFEDRRGIPKNVVSD